MKLVFIRHGDPDYKNDTLTEKGWREAELLAERILNWKVENFYCSPLGRAKDTASILLKKVKREAIICDWLQEFNAPVDNLIPDEIRQNPEQKRIPWDFLPSYWTAEPKMYDKDIWMDTQIMKTGRVTEEYQRVCEGIDTLLEKHGYRRKNNIYQVKDSNDDTIVLFCHLGVSFAIMSHMLGISAPCLWHGFFMAPTAVTVLQTEERVKGEAYFRCQVMGDTSHLRIAGEMPSVAGSYKELY
jgi:broad specificity phosphatase PhoE